MIRRLEQRDRADLIEIINGIDIFKPDEKVTAIELIDETLENKEKDEYSYSIFIYEFDNKAIGYHCVGKRYMTEGTFDLYWIVTDTSFQGKGIGKKLLNHAEEFIKEKNGYLVLAETSSQPSYEATRKFYLNNDYEVLAEIKNFYKVNDNLIIFGKYLTK
ncbi:MAG TPA: N-acetyltransferase [Ignavibacteria bacterium]|nr:N-acetyltransferase [Ignavibacteria bacterium]